MKSSPRTFKKLITNVFAALAFVLFLTTLNASGQTPRPASPASDQKILTSHDTPPPVLIADGSFIVEIEKDVFDETEGNPGQSKKYRLRPRVAGKKLYLAHIKIVDGSGELLYRGDYHDPARDLNVVITTPEGDLVNFASVGNNFQIETPNGKKLEKTSGLDQPVSSKRLGRFRVKNDAGTSETRLGRISVRKGNFTVYGVDLTDLPPGGTNGGKETKVLIWLAETP